MTRNLIKKIWGATPTLEAIGDITCKPEGSIEFSSDANKQFSSDIKNIFHGILEADHDANSVEASGLPQEIQRAAILWKGKLPEPYTYLADFVT